MNGSESKSVFAARVSDAASAAWWCLLIGFGVVAVQGVVYLAVVHIGPLLNLVACLWWVDSSEVGLIFVVFIGAFKLFLLAWMTGCIFLTLWAGRLRRTARAS